MGTIQDELKATGLTGASANSITNPPRDRCTWEKTADGTRGKLIFATEKDAVAFNNASRHYPGFKEQRAYLCPHTDHWHLTSALVQEVHSPKGTTTVYDLAKGTVTKAEKILQALQSGKYTSAKDVADAVGCHHEYVYIVARDNGIDVPWQRRTRGPAKPPAPVETAAQRLARLESELAEAKVAVAKEAFEEEQRRRVQLKSDVAGNIVVWANGAGLTVTPQQLEQLYQILKERFTKAGGANV